MTAQVTVSILDIPEVLDLFEILTDAADYFATEWPKLVNDDRAVEWRKSVDTAKEMIAQRHARKEHALNGPEA